MSQLAQRRFADYLLRAAVAFAFLYPPIAAFFNPDAWVWFVPEFVALFMPQLLFLHLFGVVQVVIGLGIICMRRPVIPAAAAVITLAGIVIINWSAFDIVFRDISILFVAFALVLLHLHEKETVVQYSHSSP